MTSALRSKVRDIEAWASYQPPPPPPPPPLKPPPPDEDEDDDCEAVYAPIDEDNADSKLSKFAPPELLAAHDDDGPDVTYQSGCGAAVFIDV